VELRETDKTADIEAGVVAGTLRTLAPYWKRSQISRSAFVKHPACSTWGVKVADFWFIFSIKSQAQREWQD
jgi:hypothetical protein